MSVVGLRIGLTIGLMIGCISGMLCSCLAMRDVMVYREHQHSMFHHLVMLCHVGFKI